MVGGDSEDSDIIAFGAETVLFKMDREGNGREYRKKLLGACDKCTPPIFPLLNLLIIIVETMGRLRLAGWEHERFLQMCIFAGRETGYFNFFKSELNCEVDLTQFPRIDNFPILPSTTLCLIEKAATTSSLSTG